MAVPRSSTDGPVATTTLRGGHLRAPSTQAVDIDEHDALDRVADESPAHLERPRGELLKHTLDASVRRADSPEAERTAEQLDPPTQRAPPSTRLLTDVLEGTHLAAHLGGAPALPPATERPGHGAQPVPQTRRHPARHHGHHGAAAATPVPPHDDLGYLGPLADAGWAELKAPPNTVANQPQPRSRWPPRSSAARAARRTHRLDARQGLIPNLDVALRNDDSSMAPSSLQLAVERDGDGCANTHPVTFFVRSIR